MEIIFNAKSFNQDTDIDESVKENYKQVLTAIYNSLKDKLDTVHIRVIKFSLFLSYFIIG